MPEPTLALKFSDLILRVAEMLGVASYAGTSAAIPTDAHDLELCKRLVNDGWRRFVNSNPAGWNWLNPIAQITFNPDGEGQGVVVDGRADEIPAAARYYLPDGFYGELTSPFSYGPDGPRLRIELTDEGSIRHRYAATGATTGDPCLAAVRPLAKDGAAQDYRPLWEVVFWPTPGTTYTVTTRCRIYPNALVSSDDRHNAGFQHDEAVLAAVRYEAALQQLDQAQGTWKAAWDDALARSIMLDARAAPRFIGPGASSSRRAWYRGVDTYNGVAV